ncbi:uncharacterized protein [Oscarella lobularis]|uniref:uncharacterized protein n=1 Tax=Oscarella lobularis TaxID=121494 RepID=UPI003313F585
MEMYTADGPLTVDGSEMHFGSGEHEEEEDNVLPQSGSAASEEVTALDLASLPPPPSPRRRRRRYHSIDSTQLTIPRATHLLWFQDTSDIVTDCRPVEPKGVAAAVHGPANVTAGFEADPLEKTAQQYSLDVLESRQSDLAATETIPEEAGEEMKEMSPLPPNPEEDEDEDEENVNVEFDAPKIEMLQEIASEDSSFHLQLKRRII